MFEPDLDVGELLKRLSTDYGLAVHSLEFLPIGADVRSFAYRCLDADSEYFLKLRLPGVSPVSIQASSFVMNSLPDAISPRKNLRTSDFWMDFPPYQVWVFPFVRGEEGWNHTLSVDQWRGIGRCVRSLHDLTFPEPLVPSLPREDFSPSWRIRAREYLRGFPPAAADVPARAFFDLLQAKRQVVLDVVDGAQALAEVVKSKSLGYRCCHGDLHSGNFLIERGRCRPVDWDTLSWAPKEKDLMFIGGGIGGMLDAPGGPASFYEGYGEVAVDGEALRYFRLERIVQDVVAYCEELLDSTEGGDARATMLGHFARQFEPGGVIDAAR